MREKQGKQPNDLGEEKCEKGKENKRAVTQEKEHPSHMKPEHSNITGSEAEQSVNSEGSITDGLETMDVTDKANSDSDEILRLKEAYRRFGIEGEEASMNEIMDRLSTFSEHEDRETTTETADKKTKKKSLLARRKALILVIAAAAAIGLCIYSFILRPWIDSQSEDEAPELIVAAPEDAALGKCETIGSSNRIYLFAPTDSSAIQKLEVYNAEGGYTFEQTNGKFVIEGAEDMGYSNKMFSMLMFTAGKPLAIERITTNCDDFSVYGLAEEDDPAWYRLTTTQGVEHVVYIGDRISSGGGYYARYEGREAVYILNTYVETVLSDVRSFMTPNLIIPVDSNAYTEIRTFTIVDHDEMKICIDAMSAEEQEQTGGTYAFKMLYPASYRVSDNYTQALTAVMSLEGTAVVAYNLTDEIIASYGLVDPAYELLFKYQDEEQYLLFSEKDPATNSYYVLSPMFDLIATVDAESVSFLEWDLIQFIDPLIYAQYIYNLDTIEISDGESEYRFRIQGDAKESLTVTEEISGKTVNTKDFQSLYSNILSIENQGYAETTDSSALDCMATLRFTTRTGQTEEFGFYPYSTRRCLCTVDGRGELYVLRDMVQKMLTGAEDLTAGRPVKGISD